MLFTDVVNCIQTQNIELKKLVYLYLINYAKSQPDLAILAVNTFVKVGSADLAARRAKAIDRKRPEPPGLSPVAAEGPNLWCGFPNAGSRAAVRKANIRALVLRA